MKILKLHLTNIKSYDNTTIEFEPGTNSIHGENGAGKTTILEAIGWALFDFLPYSQDEFLREGAKYGTVSVTFVPPDGREYQVIRQIKKSPPWYVLDLETGYRVAEGSADVKEWLKKVMGLQDEMDLGEIFENAVGVPQGALCAPFLMTSSKRKDTFNAMLHLEEYKTAFDNLRETDRYIQDQLLALGNWQETLKVFRDRIPELEEKIHGLANENNRIDDELRTCENDLASVREIKRQLEQKQKQIEALEGEHRRHEERINSLRDHLAKARQDLERSKQARDILLRTREGHLAYERAVQERRELEPQLETYRQLCQNLQLRQSDRNHLNAEIKEKQAELNNALSAQEILPRLQSKVDELRKIQKEHQQLTIEVSQLRALETRHADITQKLSSLDAELKNCKQTIQVIEQKRPLAEKLPALRKEYDSVQSQLSAAEGAKEKLNDLRKKYSSIEKEIVTLSAEITKLESEISSIELLQKESANLLQLRNRKNLLQERQKEMEIKISKLEQRLELDVPYCPLNRDDCLHIQQGERNCDLLSQQIQEAKSELETIIQDLQSTEQSIQHAEAAQAKLFEAEKAKAAYDPKLYNLQIRQQEKATLEKDLRELINQVEQIPSLQSSFEHIKSEVEAAEQADKEFHKLPVIEEKISNLTRQIEELREEQKQITEQIKDLSSKKQLVDKLEKRLQDKDTFEEKLTKAKLLVEHLPETRASLESLKRDLQNLEKVIEQLNSQIDDMKHLEQSDKELQAIIHKYEPEHKQYISNEQLAMQLEEKDAQVSKLQSEIDGTVKQLEEINAQLEKATKTWNRQDLEDAELKIEKLNADISSLRTQKANNLKQISNLEQELSDYQEKSREYDRVQQDIQKFEKIKQILQHIRNTIKSAQEPIAKSLIYGISLEARNIFCEIMGDHSQRLEWTDDYEIRLERGSERLTFQQMSGGEQMSAALAVRLALLKRLSEINIAFLDEPTQNMDTTRRMNLADQVVSLKGFEQLFVISHDDTFEQKMDRAIIVSKRHGISQVTYS